MGRGLVTLGLGDATDDGAGAPDETGTGPAPITGPVAPPRARPGGMAVSAILHALLIAMVVQVAIVHAPEASRPVLPRTPRADAVFLPPPATVRKMLGLRPLPVPRPPEAKEKDRISIGAPAPMRSPDVLHLNRDDDLTKSAKGLPTASQAPRPSIPEPAPPAPNARPAGAILSSDGRLAQAPLTPGRPGPIQASLRKFEASGIGDPGPLGVVTGTGGQMGPLFFDPQGADFTEWVQRFKNEVYRNWIPPPSASLGWTGQVDFEFVVERSGTMTEVRLLEGSGTAAYDRAARNALVASRLLPLPADFAPTTVTMKVGFVYNVRQSDSGRSGR
jgi:TonB family protein